MKLVVTGAGGFLGRHVFSLLQLEHDAEVTPITRDTPADLRHAAFRSASAVLHLAGVNRPRDEHEFIAGNIELTRDIAAELATAGRRATLVLASTSRAEESTPYGRSKLGAEQVVREYAEQTGAAGVIFRLPNVFGKWSRPDYNSAVATFCHNIARDLPVVVHDERTVLRLVYGEDVARAMIREALNPSATGQASFADTGPCYERSLGEIVALLRQFRALRTELVLPDFSDSFVQKLYSTYAAFLPLEEIAYPLRQFTDERGSLAELLKSRWFGQVFLSRSHPGITRGNHFHHTKTEKFVVMEGDAVICVRPIQGREVTQIRVSGGEFRVVDIPPGYTHSITNVGTGELITLFWSSEIFDPERTDTYAMDVRAHSP